MKQPSQEQLDVIEKIVTRIAKKHVFGYFDYEDIQQEARIIALDGLTRYDGRGPLENFLAVHIKNRLITFRRNNFQRDKPCVGCPLYDPCLKLSSNQCEGYLDKMDCKEYKNWFNRTEKKKNIINPVSIDNVSDEHESGMRDESDFTVKIENREILSYIEERIPNKYRPDYIKMKSGVKITRVKLSNIQEIIKGILEDLKNGV